MAGYEPCAKRMRHNSTRIAGSEPDDASEPNAKIRSIQKPSLIELDMHCILKIFHHINIEDFCSMAETCTTFSNYAKYYFRLKHRSFDFASMRDGSLLSIDKATRFFQSTH